MNLKRGLLSLILSAYSTSKRTTTQATPFSLVYRSEEVVLIEVIVHSPRLAFASRCTTRIRGFRGEKKSASKLIFYSENLLPIINRLKKTLLTAVWENRL